MRKLIIGLAALLSFGSAAYAQDPDPPVAEQAEAAAIAAREVRYVEQAVVQTLPTPAPTQAAAPAPTSRVSRVTGKRDADGYFQWRVVGVRNLRIYQGAEFVRHTQVLAMRKMGVTEAEISDVVTALKRGTAEEGQMTKGMKFSQMTFATERGVQVMGRVMYVGNEVHRIWRIRTSTGRVITIVEKCDNVALEEAPPPPPAPPPAILPPPPTILPPPAPTPEAKRFCELWEFWRPNRVNAVAGAELELKNGMSRSLYGTWGVYCMKMLKDGQIGLGLAGQLAVYGGDPGRGHFKGHLIAAGVGMMRVWNSGQDLEAKLMIGDYSGRYRETDYRSREHRTLLAASVAHNDYSGRIDGSNRPERQIFGMIGLPIGGHSGHKWQGQQLDNPSELKLYWNAGVRQYLLKEDPKRKLNPYLQLGALGEIRSGEDYFSCSVRLGVTNRRRTIGVHAGINTCNGSVIGAIGFWYDFGTDIRLARAERRAKAIMNDTGEDREVTATFSGRRLLVTRE